MVGKLARYLRMAGINVLYRNDYSDEEILETAKKEERIILTRDALMLQRKDCKNNIIRSLYIKSSRLKDQLKQVESELGIKLEPNLIRCIECNSLLENAQKDKIKNKVPHYVFMTHEVFLFCSRCNKYYWRGTHYNNIYKAFQSFSSIDLEPGNGVKQKTQE